MYIATGARAFQMRRVRKKLRRKKACSCYTTGRRLLVRFQLTIMSTTVYLRMFFAKRGLTVNHVIAGKKCMGTTSRGNSSGI